MIREEAIDLLDNLIGMVEDNHNSDYDTALQMGIKALEQEPILEKIKAEIEELEYDDFDCNLVLPALKVYDIIDNYIAELKRDKCDNNHDCEHCDWVECPLDKENKQ